MKHLFSSITNLICVLAVGFFLGVAIPPSHALVTAEKEQLLVFVQNGSLPVGIAFRDKRLPDIRKLADEMGVSLHVVDARQGSPASVAVTPLIVYQNHRGRSIYQGRTTTLARIRNFIRTSRFVPQGKTPFRRENTAVWENGRTRLWAPLKITSVTGDLPRHFDQAAFSAEAVKSINSGFQRFRFRKEVALGRADRGFYMDFHPWLSRDGTLYLSLAVFSEFDCKNPVFTSKLSGAWKERKQLFENSAVVMEQAVGRIKQNPVSGDSFDVVASSNPVRSWEDLGFPLPPEPEKKRRKVLNLTDIPRHWVFVKPGKMDPPMIQFRFAPPLDNYAGEVKEGRGELSFKENNRLNGASGVIEIDTRSAITMGNAVLDEAIQGSFMLNTREFPTAKFTIETVESSIPDLSPEYGKLIPASVNGIFTLKGKSIPLACPAEFELGVGEDEKPTLSIRSAFTIDLRIFNIEGADGPEPARFTMLFDVNFLLKQKK